MEYSQAELDMVELPFVKQTWRTFPIERDLHLDHWDVPATWDASLIIFKVIPL